MKPALSTDKHETNTNYLTYLSKHPQEPELMYWEVKHPLSDIAYFLYYSRSDDETLHPTSPPTGN